MAQQIKNMKDAVFKGTGVGLQETSQTLGETVAGESDMRGPGSRKADAASASIGEFANANKTGATTAGTSVSGADQITNMQTGAADHLDMNFRKKV